MKINKIILSALIVGVQSIHAQISNNYSISPEKLDSFMKDKQYKVKLINKKSINDFQLISKYEIIDLKTSKSKKVIVEEYYCPTCGMG